MSVRERAVAPYLLQRSLREALRPFRARPALAPALLATVSLVVLATADAGYYPTSWAAAGLFLLALLALSLFLLSPPRGVPRLTVIALALFAGFVLWSYLSIAWADQPDLAWEGANRSLVYLVVFAQFSLWPIGERGVRMVLAVLGLGIAALASVELARMIAGSDLSELFIDVRLADPAGYTNANAALWTTGMLPCLFLASRREVAVALRGASLAAGGLLAAMALMVQSRGWVLIVPLALVLLVLLPPRRMRTLIAVVAAGLGAAAVSQAVLAVRDEFTPDRFPDLVQSAGLSILAMVLVLALVGTLWGLAERRAGWGTAPRSPRLGAGGAAVLVLAFAAVAAVALERGLPARVQHAWREFQRGGQGPKPGTARLTSARGSNRYDFWRVASDLFVEHPLNGVGVDNFQQPYLRRARSPEQPQFPHSFELAVLSQTGLVGALLLGGALLAAGVGSVRALRGPPGAAACAGVSLAVFGYWLLHGSLDWFWELPALTAPALALLAVGAPLSPRMERAPRPLTARTMAIPLAAGAVLAASLGLTWMSERDIRQAGKGWSKDPEGAFHRLRRAAALDPLSAKPQLTAGTIALRLGRKRQAERSFREALDRRPGDSYALLELGLLAGGRGDLGRARGLLRDASEAAPRDEIISSALAAARRGKVLDVDAVNLRILRFALSQGR